MSQQFLVSIRSVSPDSRWIRRFIKEIEAGGGDIRKIAFFGLFHEDRQLNWHDAKRMSDEVDEDAEHVLELFLHPHEHKHYLRSVCSFDGDLRDPRVTVVFDLQDIPPEKTDGLAQVVNTGSVMMVIERLGERYGTNRVLDRKQAINMLIGKLAT
jgi:hypothetical protein